VGDINVGPTLIFRTLTLTLALLLGGINVGPILRKWVSHKAVEPIWVLLNKRVIVRVSVEKRVCLTILF
jgi:hypothetical protein